MCLVSSQVDMSFLLLDMSGRIFDFMLDFFWVKSVLCKKNMACSWPVDCYESYNMAYTRPLRLSDRVFSGWIKFFDFGLDFFGLD